MGFYLRRAFGFGPLRLNLSKSGVGFSVGVKGARIGVSPRGQAYVHAGRAGFYFKQNIGGPSQQRGSPSLPQPTRPPSETLPDNVEMIESATARSLTDISQAEMLAALQRVHQRCSRVVLVAIAAFALAITGIALGASDTVQLSPLLWTTLAIVLITATALGFSRAYGSDTRDGTVRLTFDVEPEVGERIASLHHALSELMACERVWSVVSRQDTNDWKRHAGAQSLVARRAVALSKQLPRGVECNDPVICLPAGHQTLYFFPFGLTIYDASGIGILPYNKLHVESGNVSFREGDSVPNDGHVLSHTWLYVNKNGDPDKRFNNNRQLPIMDYGVLRLTSETGLNELFHTSRSPVAKNVELAVKSMPAITSQIRRTSSTESA